MDVRSTEQTSILHHIETLFYLFFLIIDREQKKSNQAVKPLDCINEYLIAGSCSLHPSASASESAGR